MSDWNSVYDESIRKDLTTIENRELISNYKPRFLGSGAEHYVFSLEGRPDVVAKVKIDMLDYGSGVDLEEDDLNEYYKIIVDDRRRYLKMREYFGSHVLSEHSFLMEVPVPNEPVDVLTIVRIQRRLPVEALVENGGVSLLFSNKSLFRSLKSEDYLKSDSVLLDGADYEGDMSYGGVVEESIVKRVDEDEDFSGLVRYFVETAVDYTMETGEILDVFGVMNVVFFHDGDEWDFLMPDARHEEKKCLELARRVVESSKKSGWVNMDDFDSAFAAIDYVRFINSLAIITGSSKRISFSQESVAEDVGALYTDFMSDDDFDDSYDFDDGIAWSIDDALVDGGGGGNDSEDDGGGGGSVRDRGWSKYTPKNGGDLE